MRRREPMLTGPDRRWSMYVDPAQVPAELTDPSTEAGQRPGRTAPQGWECPRCHRVYAPWVPCCGTCGTGDDGGRTEITEARSGLDKAAEAVRAARGGDAPVQIQGFA
jgi:hypothetical protein